MGTDVEVKAAAGRATETIDLAGRLLSPGFTDAHVHAVYGGLERIGCDLSPCQGMSEVLARVRDYAGSSEKEWVTGGGWTMTDFPGGTPGRELLDAILPDRPAYLVNRDRHGAWVNSRALELAGVNAATPDPSDGRIERDGAGNPTGTLHEGAMEMVARHIPPPSIEELTDGLLEAQRHLHAHGVTGWQEAIIGDYAGYPDVSGAYLRLQGEGLLSGRATGALWVPRSTTVDNIAELVTDFTERRHVNTAGGFPTTSAKIMVDGVPENQTAAMLQPYENPCTCGGPVGSTGLTYLPEEVLREASAALDRAGFDLHMHVIGDRAVRSGLNAVAHTRRLNGRGVGRHHMAHIQIIHPADIARFAELDVTANAQALWASNSAQMTDLTIPLLGAERAGWQYPFGSLVSSGARLAMGSDWPVSTPDPWQAIHVAVNRTEPRHPDQAPLVPDQALDLTTALMAYTHRSAWLNRQETAGRIKTGYLADLVMLDRNPFEQGQQDLYDVRTQLTVVDGKVAYHA
ncbi:amidohydrolase [Paenarthrobacter sp. NEAU-H11]|uniref:amidohydrolase n=1 Tax=Paenarthrobacter sp. NEAU-H11 TaxID=3423924 RepID=UPI003D344714